MSAEETNAPTPFRDVWARSEDGLRLHARLYGEEDGAGLPLVCLPGLTRNASEFHLLASALLSAGAAGRIVAVDYRGRGLSDHDPDPSHYAIPVESADLLVVLAELGIAAAIFVGVSRGGMISMGLGAVRPDLVRGIVLNDIGPAVERAGLLRIKGYVGTFGAPRDLDEAAGRLRATFAGQFPNLAPAEWRDWAGTVWTEAESGLVLAYDPALARTLDAVDAESPIPDLWPFFDRLGDVPVMVVRGALTDLLSAGTVDEMARRHPGLVSIEVPDEGHTPFLHRPALAARICRFVAGVNAGDAARRAATR